MKYIFIVMLLLPLVSLSKPEIKDLPLSAVESAYWDCDYASTTGFIGGNDAAVCSLMFEELKKRKFNGKFNKFMDWWKLNKEFEHKKRAS